MRKFIKPLLIIIAFVVVCVGMYTFANHRSKQNSDVMETTTTTQLAVTEKNLEKKISLFASKKDDFYLYRQGDLIILEHDNKEYTFENWSKYITLEKPKVYMTDLDDDGDLELIVRVVGNVDSNNHYYHYVYVLNDEIDDNGEVNYFVTIFSQNSVKELITEHVISEVSQLKDCKKIGIFAMCMNYNSINYDNETGLPDSYYNTFAISKGDNGQYPTITSWDKGLVDFSVEKDCIRANYPIYVSFRETNKKQYIGFISCGFYIEHSKRIGVRSKSLLFKPNYEYKTFETGMFDGKAWSKSFVNKNKNTSGKSINALSFDLSFDKKNPVDFAKANTDNNSISKIVATESYVEFTAKKGCHFNESIAQSNDFSIFMKSFNMTAVLELDIGYESTIHKDKDGNEVLRLSFDQKYGTDTMKNIKILFGEI